MIRYKSIVVHLATIILNSRRFPLNIWRQAFMRMMRSGSFLKVFPFTWDTENRKLLACQVSKSLAWHILFLLFCLDLFYLASMSRRVSLATYSDSQFIHFFVHIFKRSSAGALAASMAVHKHGLLNFSYALMEMQKRFQATLCKQTN